LDFHASRQFRELETAGVQISDQRDPEETVLLFEMPEPSPFIPANALSPESGPYGRPETPAPGNVALARLAQLESVRL
jgi:hypothetical protein